MWERRWARLSGSPTHPTFGCMGYKLGTCAVCNGPQLEIERFGEQLVGCIECNWWTWPTSENICVTLTKDDLEALKANVTRATGLL